VQLLRRQREGLSTGVNTLSDLVGWHVHQSG